jgi:hypothetical protein
MINQWREPLSRPLKFGIAVAACVSQSFGRTMRLTFALGLRSCVVAATLLLATATASEPKNPLIGANREQLLARFGEPKSTIVAGEREVWFYPKQRLVLRNGTVVEVQPIEAEPVRRPAPVAVEPTPAPPVQATAPTQGAAPSAAPVATAQPAPGPAQAAAPSSTTGPAVAPTAMPPAVAPAPEEQGLEIKRVRPPPADFNPSAPTDTTTLPAMANTPAAAASVDTTPVAKSTPSAPVATTTAPADANAAPSSTATGPSVPSRPAAEPAATPTSKTTGAPETTAPVAATDASTATPAPPEPPATVTPPPEDKAKARKLLAVRQRVREARDEQAEPPLISPTTYVIAAIVVFGGVGYLIWRSRQRNLALAATAVSRTPFAGPTATDGGARFTVDLLAKLEWKRFEELVASYYSKTGVVAERTKSGPASPVNIKISWKGEPRPFACVKCIARPAGLIDVRPVQELFTTISADDIRRGYVVSTGKFNVPARDYAEEKHLTLLPGDLLLEKLNALPDSARAELLQETTTGDYSTPSCPKCEKKMVRSADDPERWQCPDHPDQTIAAV